MLYLSIVLVILVFLLFLRGSFFINTLKNYPATDADYLKIRVKKINKSNINNPIKKEINPLIENIQITHNNKSIKVKEFLKETDSDVLLLIKNKKIIYENYSKNYSSDTPLMVWSVTKVFVSALLDIAIKEGKIKSINDKVITYIPELKNKIAGNVKIKHLLNMTSGINFSTSKYNFTPYLAVHYGDNLMKYVLEAKSEFESGKNFRYSQIDPILLAIILRRVTNKPLYEYLEEKIWIPLGMQYDAYWAVDESKEAIERASSGIFITAEDLARFGQVFIHNDNNILTTEFINQSIQTETNRVMVNFWRNHENLKNNSKCIITVGANGNKIMLVFPKEELIIIRSGSGLKNKSLKDALLDFAFQYQLLISSVPATASL